MIKEMDIGEGVFVRLLYNPSGRHEIVESIKELADFEYQQREWTKKSKDRYNSDMVYIDHTLHDDHGVLDDLEVCIRKIDVLFYDEEEARLVQELCYFLVEEVYMDIDSSNPTDIEYMNHPHWPQLMAKAAEVYKIMKANNKKYNSIECHNMHNDCHQEYRDWQANFRLERGKDIFS